MFMQIDRIDRDNIAAISETGESITYGGLCDAAVEIARGLRRGLVFCFCENTLGSLCGYVSFLSHGIVALMLDRNLNERLRESLIDTYKPGYIWAPEEMRLAYERIRGIKGYCLMKTNLQQYELNDRLALLLTTSGSTGSPKLVRQSYRNIEDNARNIAEYLELDHTERPITTLPMNYVYGLSIINSHLLKGATLLLTTHGILSKEFWSFFKEQQATSFGGVPYTYEMLKKIRFSRMELPSLRTLTQAGGKLLPELHREFAEYANDTGRRFYVMYGAAEATSRMGYLPYEMALCKCGSMGIAIPNGEFYLIDSEGGVITEPDTVGELVYRGENVTLGYAERGADLSKPDENGGVLHTGDMARRDSDGYYYIVGRKKRFLKVFGNRLNLDEMERLVKSEFELVDCACAGVDDMVYVFITHTGLEDRIRRFVAHTTGLHHTAFKVRLVPDIPKNEAGKILYAELNKYYD